MPQHEYTPEPIDESKILAAYHEALLQGTSVDVPSEDPSFNGVLRCLRMMERNRQSGSSGGDELSALPTPFEFPSGQASSRPVRIGRFQIVRRLGQGGNGVVFLAKDPQLDREVAFKVPTAEALLRPEYVRRFEREAQVAANLHHPHIVPIYETGSVGPISYIASEYCKGPTLSQWMAENPLPIQANDAVDLVRVLTEAVHHAHSRGILHRDIKPSNVLFQLQDDGPKLRASDLSSAARLTDFGLAKRLDDDMTFTAPAAILGTPAYMAPEQADGSSADVGTHTDVFALGAVLYELLTGKAPFRRDTPLATLKAIQTESHDFRTDLAHAPRDVVEIVRKCLEKRPADRYSSARELGFDLAAFLDGRPVQARPMSSLGKLGRWVSSNPFIATLMATIAILVTSLAIGSTLAALRLNTAQERVESEAASLSALAAFLENEILTQASPYGNPKRDLTLRETLQQAEQNLAGYFHQRPLLEARIRTTLGSTYLQLAQFDAAEGHLQRGLQIYLNHYGRRHQTTLRQERLLGQLWFKQGEFDRAAKQWSRLLQDQENLATPGETDALITKSWLAYCYAVQRRFSQSEAMFEEASGGLQRALGQDHPKTLDCLNSMAQLYIYQERFQEAERLLTEILETRGRVLGKQHPQYIETLANVGRVRLHLGSTQEAIRIFEQVTALSRRVLGDSHPDTLSATERTVNALRVTVALDKAEQLLKEKLAVEREVYGTTDERTLATMSSLAALNSEREHYPEEIELRSEIIAVRRGILEGDHLVLAEETQRLGRAYGQVNDLESARDCCLEAVEMLTRLYGETDPRVELARYRMASVAPYRSAVQLLNSQLEQLNSRGEGNSLAAIRCHRRLGYLYRARRQARSCPRRTDRGETTIGTTLQS